MKGFLRLPWTFQKINAHINYEAVFWALAGCWYGVETRYGNNNPRSWNLYRLNINAITVGKLTCCVNCRLAVWVLWLRSPPPPTPTSNLITVIFQPRTVGPLRQIWARPWTCRRSGRHNDSFLAPKMCSGLWGVFLCPRRSGLLPDYDRAANSCTDGLQYIHAQ